MDVYAHPGVPKRPLSVSAVRLSVLDDLAGLGPFFSVGSHPAGAQPVAPWRQAGELTAPTEALRDRVTAVRAALAARGGLAVRDIEPRVAASAVHLGLAARLVAPALGAAVLSCPLDLRPPGLWWQDTAGGPVPLSVQAPDSERESRPPGDGTGLVTAQWDRLLLEETIAPLTAAVALLVPVSGRVLWGNVASAANAAAAQVARARPDLAAEAWRAAGRLLASPRLRAEPSPPGPAFRRASCCLFYRLAPGNPSAICGDCVLGARQEDRGLSRTTSDYSLPRSASSVVAGPERQ